MTFICVYDEWGRQLVLACRQASCEGNVHYAAVGRLLLVLPALH